MEQIIYSLNLDLRQNSHKVLVMKEDDVNSRVIEAVITDNGKPYELTDCAVNLKWRKPDGHIVYATAEKSDYATVRVVCSEQMLAVAGIAEAEFEITDNNSVVSTLKFSVSINETVISDEDIESSDDFSALQDIVAHVGNDSIHVPSGGTSGQALVRDDDGNAVWGDVGGSGGVSGEYLTKENPIGTGSFSLNRKANSTIGSYSVAMGNIGIASGNSSYVVGFGCTSSGNYSFSGGYNCEAYDSYSVAIGYYCKSGEASLSIGKSCKATDSSFAMGNSCEATGGQSFAGGMSCKANIDNSFAMGYNCVATGNNYTYVSFAMGKGCTSNGGFALGTACTSNGGFSMGHGCECSSSGFAMGDSCTSYKQYSIAMGYNCVASGKANLVVGYKCTTSDDYATAIGYNCNASKQYSIAMGYNCVASGDYSTAIGGLCEASGILSVALGNAIAKGNYSLAVGQRCIASGLCQFTYGKFNIEDTENKYAHIVGGGTSLTDRKNIHTLDWQGNAVFAGDVTYNKSISLSEMIQNLCLCIGTFKEAEIVNRSNELGEVKMACIPYSECSVLTTSNKIAVKFTNGSVGVFNVNSTELINLNITWLTGTMPYVSSDVIQSGTNTLAINNSGNGYATYDDTIFNEDGSVKQRMILEISSSDAELITSYRII